ncbi:periplasmic chaperone for outer membrane proteins Skp [Bisgaardia hudsonensis]|uniref:Periplasmic chaperone for outer membrane proteins Skp n=1 Tax=Bisgaardia hudsonensis TaxID=109472 RepID=A0A4R2N2W2_9PAST|nr:OmpH family outer membrane protein [Bisgaardia hudsonensis]QLB12635.1 hypothetical protein A6A11_02940 [Bisgaardia hudsonensis]TCP14177.1 periplasmic chaperone for outer membrane proteins Skp [Bisgaardia hudsonensis]
MNKIVQLATLSLALSSSIAMAEENIAFINVDYLYVNHPARMVELKKLDAEFKEPADKLKAEEKKLADKKDALEKEIEDKVKKLEKEAPKLRSADIKKRQDEITKLAEKSDAEFKKLVSEHQKNVADFQAQGQKRENEINQKLLADIQSATNSIAKAKNYTIVLDGKTAIYAIEGKDITEDVLKAIPEPKTAEKPATK